MASKRRNMFYQNKKQETTEIEDGTYDSFCMMSMSNKSEDFETSTSQESKAGSFSTDKSRNEKKTCPDTVFISNGDLYNGKYLAVFFSRQKCGHMLPLRTEKTVNPEQDPDMWAGSFESGPVEWDFETKCSQSGSELSQTHSGSESSVFSLKTQQSSKGTNSPCCSLPEDLSESKTPEPISQANSIGSNGSPLNQGFTVPQVETDEIQEAVELDQSMVSQSPLSSYNFDETPTDPVMGTFHSNFFSRQKCGDMLSVRTEETVNPEQDPAIWAGCFENELVELDFETKCSPSGSKLSQTHSGSESSVFSLKTQQSSKGTNSPCCSLPEDLSESKMPEPISQANSIGSNGSPLDLRFTMPQVETDEIQEAVKSDQSMVSQSPLSSYNVDESPTYHIIGTFHSNDKSPGISEVIKKATEDPNSLLKGIMKSEIVIYDVTEMKEEVHEARMALEVMLEQCEMLADQLEENIDDYTAPRKFLLITTIAAWTYVERPDGQMLTEADFESRTSFPENYEELAIFEAEFPALLKTFVVCIGIPYGYEQNLLANYFNYAWSRSDYLPMYGKGENKIPLIHICDLARIIYSIAVAEQSSGKYIFAMEPESHTVYENFDEDVMRLLACELDFKSTYIKDELQIEWRNNVPFAYNLENICMEYTDMRDLDPLKIIVLGPPGVGKTDISRLIHSVYRVEYISVRTVIESFTMKLASLIRKAQSDVDLITAEDLSKPIPYFSNEEFIFYHFPDIDFRSKQGKLDLSDKMILERGREKLDNERDRNKNMLKEETVAAIFQLYLNQPRALKQGYVMDGYPKDPYQAKRLFPNFELPSWLTEGENILENPVSYRTDSIFNHMPNMIINLEASNDAIMFKLLQNPDSGYSFSFDEMVYRFEKYTTSMDSAFNINHFFENQKLRMKSYNVDSDMSKNLTDTFKAVISDLGIPRLLSGEDELEKFEKLALRLQEGNERKEKKSKPAEVDINVQDTQSPSRLDSEHLASSAREEMLLSNLDDLSLDETSGWW
ncbi:hypothetical protein AAG570_008264 [Ranatra chinensis]|uniref:Nucleoside-diphosphate kinase n=1 Tax=Ranatra chinensis TaxID=642074 RepID=A0ABD0XU37_9HEMI